MSVGLTTVKTRKVVLKTGHFASYILEMGQLAIIASVPVIIQKRDNLIIGFVKFGIP
jgi:hypothetical protein